MAADYVLAIDAGTTGIRVNAYDRDTKVRATAYRELTQHYPQPGWVEHDAEEIWAVVRGLVAEVLAAVGGHRAVAAIGITNQRETTVLWDARTGAPLHRAIVWQDRRTAPLCERLRAEGREPWIRAKTGLVCDAYFSATKLAWLLKNALRPGAAGLPRFGTVDTWLAHKLSGGEAHVTDPTNASRTLLYDIDRRAFDPELVSLFGARPDMLPRVVGSAERYGETAPDLFGGPVPLAGIAGDQQAALFGQGCVRPGESKNTYGTGCFALVNCGDSKRPREAPGLLTTLACDARGGVAYALEGAVFIAGAAVQWLRDGLGVIASAAETEALARSVEDAGGVYFVPAFVGLGAPYWDMDARGAILGLTRGTTRAHVVRAAIEAICYQTRDLLEAFARAGMGAAAPSPLAGDHRGGDGEVAELRVDGGAARNDFLLEFQAGILGKPIFRPENIESTALGAALLAGLATGFWRDFEEVEPLIRAGGRRFEPRFDESRRETLYGGWKAAVARVLSKRA